MTSEQLQKYARLRKALVRAEQALRAYEAELVPICDHPSEYVREYRWEHDNGYGRQTIINGKRCSICSAIKHWPSSNRWDRL